MRLVPANLAPNTDAVSAASLTTSRSFSSTHVVRRPGDGTFPALPGPILHLFEGRQNLGRLQASGIDVDVAADMAGAGSKGVKFAFNGTYAAHWKQQLDGVSSDIRRGEPSLARFHAGLTAPCSPLRGVRGARH